MARWTGDPHISAVLEGAEAWRQRCFVGSGSIFTDRQLWTVEHLAELSRRFSENPIVGTTRDFLDKLKEQIARTSPAIPQLAAEVIWFLYLFPGTGIMKTDTKRKAIETIWSWSGEALPESAYLDDDHLAGVGHPGTAYLTLRPSEFEYVLRTVWAFKKLSAGEQRHLLDDDAPWSFGTWLDQQEGSDRRLARNVFLYFLFPDDIERNLSREHRQQIYEALKGKLPPDKRIRSRNRSPLDYDRAIREIRRVLEQERATKQIDFYQDDIKSQWFPGYREGRRKEFTSWLDDFLTDHGLRLNQSGRDTSMEKLRNNESISPDTGFWTEDSGLTAKPPRWLIQFDLTSENLNARVPDEHRARNIGFANTKGGDSGALAVRILPIAKTAENTFQPIESWEWLLLFCFPGGLKPGSAAQTFDDYDPATGTLTYMGAQIPYIFSGLLCLNDPDDSFSMSVGGSVKSITYREATEALGKLINVAQTGANNG